MDYVVSIIIIIFASFLLYYNMSKIGGVEDLELVIIKHGVENQRLDIKKDLIVNIDEHNTIQIKSGVTKMIYSDCKDQICVHTKSINKSGEMIVCLPNALVIKLEGKLSPEDKEVDTIAN